MKPAADEHDAEDPDRHDNQGGSTQKVFRTEPNGGGTESGCQNAGDQQRGFHQFSENAQVGRKCLYFSALP